MAAGNADASVESMVYAAATWTAKPGREDEFLKLMQSLGDLGRRGEGWGNHHELRRIDKPEPARRRSRCSLAPCAKASKIAACLAEERSPGICRSRRTQTSASATTLPTGSE